MYVTFSEACPIPALITETGTPFCRAVVAQLWRATWNIHGKASNSEQV